MKADAALARVTAGCVLALVLFAALLRACARIESPATPGQTTPTQSDEPLLPGH